MSSTLLDARQITRRFGTRLVLDSVDLSVSAQDRIALIGPNGAGKSTLLRIVAGLDQPDGGTVTCHGTVGYLPQITAAADRQRTVRETIRESTGVAAASRDLELWTHVLERGDLDAVGAHADALERWLALGGADVDGRIDAAAAEVGLASGLLDRTLGTLSGGQAARAGLAALQVARFDVVLLDEPTNHLDVDGLQQLKLMLSARAGGVVLVSHDRALLAETANDVVELDPLTGQASHFGGGFEAYERERAAARARARAEHEQAVERRTRLIAAERETRRRAAASVNRARARVHDNDKHSRQWVSMRAEEMAGRARKMATRTRRIDVPDAPREDRVLRLGLTPAERRQPWVLALEGVLLRRGEWSLGPLNFAARYGERVLVRGKNGSGKSTLLSVLAGDLAPAAGRRRVVRGAVIAQLGQTRGTLIDSFTVVEAIRDLTGLDQRDARSALASFGLLADIAERPVATLSPGERTRAELTLIAQQRATCILLDEPTNHLDVESLEALETALAAWPGALIVATHDRRLQSALRLDREMQL